MPPERQRATAMTDANTDGARMVAACTSGDERAVREVRRETPPLARHVPVGPLAPLHYAVRDGHASIVQLLLQHGADAHVVVERAVWGIPLRTVDVAADINARGLEFHETPLAAAVRSALGSQEPKLAERRRRMVEFLLKRGAATNLPDDEPWATPLAWARKLGRADIEEILLKHGATG
jgi:ankyrin repeat protein